MPNETNQLEETRELPEEIAEENDAPEKEVSFQKSFEEKINNVLSEPVAKETKEAAKKVSKKKVATPVEAADGPSLDYNSLFEDVYGAVFDSEKDQDKMKALKSVLEKEPHLKQMAIESPEKFALYFYRLS
tara:strand:+ start:286 stop:678 length:393 start_codon:yes stop_codon:yes gene_type:complete